MHIILSKEHFGWCSINQAGSTADNIRLRIHVEISVANMKLAFLSTISSACQEYSRKTGQCVKTNVDKCCGICEYIGPFIK
jgi:hypothetical protein